MITSNEKRKKASKKMIAIAASVLAFMVMLAMVKPVYVSAAEEATITVSSERAAQGDEVRFAVTASGDNIGRVDAVLKYDKSMLTYVSGGQSKGDNGTVQLKKSTTENDIKFKLIFKAKKAGDTALTIVRAHAYDMDDKSMKCSSFDGGAIISESAAENGEGDVSPGNDVSEKASGENADDEKASGEDDQSADPEVIAQPDDGNGQGEKDPGSKKSNNGMMLIITVAVVAVIAILLIVIIMKRVKKNKNDPDNW